MLEPKIGTKGFDVTGRILTLEELTRDYATNNLTGFGTPNPERADIEKVFVTVSKYDDPKVYQAEIEWDLENDFEIQSELLGTSTQEQGFIPFQDGVYDVNAYYSVAPVALTGNVGNIYLQGINTDNLVQTYDSVLIGEKIYKIDKSLPTNGGTLLYLDQPLESNVTSVEPMYRAQVYAMNVSNTTCSLKGLIGKSCKQDKLLAIYADLMSASIIYLNNNFEKAHQLSTVAYKRAKQCGGCGC